MRNDTISVCVYVCVCVCEFTKTMCTGSVTDGVEIHSYPTLQATSYSTHRPLLVFFLPSPSYLGFGNARSGRHDAAASLPPIGLHPRPQLPHVLAVAREGRLVAGEAEPLLHGAQGGVPRDALRGAEVGEVFAVDGAEEEGARAAVHIRRRAVRGRKVLAVRAPRRVEVYDDRHRGQARGWGKVGGSEAGHGC